MISNQQSQSGNRRTEGAANATIKLELATRERMFNLGAQENPPKVDRVPYIPNIEVNNVEEGYFEDSDYNTVPDQFLTVTTS